LSTLAIDEGRADLGQLLTIGTTAAREELAVEADRLVALGHRLGPFLAAWLSAQDALSAELESELWFAIADDEVVRVLSVGDSEDHNTVTAELLVRVEDVVTKQEVTLWVEGRGKTWGPMLSLGGTSAECWTDGPLSNAISTEMYLHDQSDLLDDTIALVEKAWLNHT